MSKSISRAVMTAALSLSLASAPLLGMIATAGAAQAASSQSTQRAAPAPSAPKSTAQPVQKMTPSAPVVIRTPAPAPAPTPAPVLGAGGPSLTKPNTVAPIQAAPLQVAPAPLKQPSAPALVAPAPVAPTAPAVVNGYAKPVTPMVPAAPAVPVAKDLPATTPPVQSAQPNNGSPALPALPAAPVVVNGYAKPVAPAVPTPPAAPAANQNLPTAPVAVPLATVPPTVPPAGAPAAAPAAAGKPAADPRIGQGAPALPATPSAPAVVNGYAKPVLPGALPTTPQAVTPKPVAPAPAPAATSKSDQNIGAQSSAAGLAALRVKEAAKFERAAPVVGTVSTGPTAPGQSAAGMKAANAVAPGTAGTAPIKIERIKPPKLNAPITAYNNYDSYYSNRDRFYSSRNWTPPSYVYRSYDHFGAFDAMAFWFALDAINDANQRAFLYNQMNSTAYQQWRAEADRLAASDYELRAKLDRLEAENIRLRSQGQVQDETYLPPGVDASVMLAADAVVEIPQTPEAAPVTKSGGSLWLYLIIGAGLLGGVGFLVFRRR